MGYGAPIEFPMALTAPVEPPSGFNPGTPDLGLQQLPYLSAGLKRPATPSMVKLDYMSGARRQEAEQYANDMRAAFFYNNQQTKMNRARAKAKGRAAQRFAERR